MVQGLNWTVYDALVRELMEAVSTALLSTCCAHIVAQTRVRRS